MAEDDVSMEKIQQFLGYSDINTTPKNRRAFLAGLSLGTPSRRWGSMTRVQ